MSIREADSTRGKPVEVRRGHVGLPRRMQRHVVEIVNDDEEHVGTFCSDQVIAQTNVRNVTAINDLILFPGGSVAA